MTTMLTSIDVPKLSENTEPHAKRCVLALLTVDSSKRFGGDWTSTADAITRKNGRCVMVTDHNGNRHTWVVDNIESRSDDGYKLRTLLDYIETHNGATFYARCEISEHDSHKDHGETYINIYHNAIDAVGAMSVYNKWIELGEVIKRGKPSIGDDLKAKIIDLHFNQAKSITEIVAEVKKSYGTVKKYIELHKETLPKTATVVVSPNNNQLMPVMMTKESIKSTYESMQKNLEKYKQLSDVVEMATAKRAALAKEDKEAEDMIMEAMQEMAKLQ